MRGQVVVVRHQRARDDLPLEGRGGGDGGKAGRLVCLKNLDGEGGLGRLPQRRGFGGTHHHGIDGGPLLFRGRPSHHPGDRVESQALRGIADDRIGHGCAIRVAGLQLELRLGTFRDQDQLGLGEHGRVVHLHHGHLQPDQRETRRIEGVQHRDVELMSLRPLILQGRPFDQAGLGIHGKARGRVGRLHEAKALRRQVWIGRLELQRQRLALVHAGGGNGCSNGRAIRLGHVHVDPSRGRARRRPRVNRPKGEGELRRALCLGGGP